MRFDQILADFELLDDWEDRYRYLIELGSIFATLPESEHTPANKVQGCVSQVWLSTKIFPDKHLEFAGDSDAQITKGLVAILLTLYSGKTAKDIIDIDAKEKLGELHFTEHLTPQRSNGLMSMVKRIRTDAERIL